MSSLKGLEYKGSKFPNKGWQWCDFKAQGEWKAAGLVVHRQCSTDASSDVPSNSRGDKKARGDKRKKEGKRRIKAIMEPLSCGKLRSSHSIGLYPQHQALPHVSVPLKKETQNLSKIKLYLDIWTSLAIN